MVKHLVRAIFCITLLTFLGVVANAQSFGEIKGSVVDSAGAAVPGATVEVTNETTGEKRTVTTTDNGTYTVTKLIPGSYTVAASQTNFATATTQKVVVSVSFSTPVDLMLNPAGGENVVNVSGGDAATQLNTSDQQLSTIIDSKKLLELPLLGRDPNALILLAPGSTQTDSGLGGFSVNGQRERNNNFRVDGADNNDTDVPGIPGGLATPNIDATQEFRVITSNFNAEYGRNSGATILIATKNGTNEFHGGAYIYYRSDRFSARDFFDVSGAADPLQRKQFGVSIGGPIKKDKAFFFFNYEGDRFVQGSQQTRVVPSAAARLGILNTPAPAPNCDICFGTLDIRPAGVNNGTGGLPFNPAILQIINRLYPLGNAGDGPIPGVFDTFKFGFNFDQHVDTINTRVDYQISQKHTLVTSYGYNRGDFSLFADTFPGSGDGGDTPQRSHVLQFSLVSSFSPTLINEARFSYNKLFASFNGPGDGKASTSIDDVIRTAFQANGLPVPVNLGQRNGAILNLGGGGISGLGGFDTQFRDSGTTSIADSFTWIHGNHTMKFGGEYNWIHSDGPTNFGRSEGLNFNLPGIFGIPIVVDNMGNAVPLDTGAGATINAYLSLLSGLVANQAQSQYFDKAGGRRASDDRQFRVREWGLYWQDNWRVRPNFTLNFGMRYEEKGVPWEVNGLLSNLVQDPSGPNPSAQGFEFITVGKGSDHPDIGLYEDDKNNFAPRFGFNYSPDFKTGWIAKLTGGPTQTSIRGGYGVFYDRVFGNLFSNARGNPPFEQDFNDFPGDTIENIPRPPLQVSSRFVFGARGDINNGPLLSPVIFARPGNNQFQSKFATPYTQSWNFGFQRQLGNAFLLEMDYVGNKGTDLLRVIDGNMASIARVNAILHLNPADPTRAITTSLTTNIVRGSLHTAFLQPALNVSLGHSTYNALQSRITKTLTNSKYGLGYLQAAYTWGHAIDNAADPLVPSLPGNAERALPRDTSGFAGGFTDPERGSSGYDVRHRLVFNFVYELPFHRSGAWGKYLLNGWTISGIEQVQSGSPYSIFANGADTQGTGLSARAYFATPGNALSPTSPDLQNPRTQVGPDRSMFVGPPCSATTPTNCVRLNGQQGNVPRGFLVGPAFHKTDFSIIKKIPITERYRFSIRADFFNAFNRVNFSLPVSNVNDDQFGQSFSTRGGDAGRPRIIQFVGRFEF
jgi:hypothetical protein